MTPRSPANRSGQHQLPTADQGDFCPCSCNGRCEGTQVSVPADSKRRIYHCCNVRFRTEVTQLTQAHLELAERKVTSLRKQPFPWCPKAHREAPLESLCKPLVGCRDCAQLQCLEQLSHPQGLRVMWYSHQTRQELAGVGLRQDSPHRKMAP